MKILVLSLLAFATPAVAFPVSESTGEMGFYVAEIVSTAPVRLLGWRDGGKVSLTPDEFVSKGCPGAVITEINLAKMPTQRYPATSVQIVFKIPSRGCLLSN